MHAVPRKRTPLEDEEEDLPEAPRPIGQPAMFSLRLRWVGLMLVCTVLWVLGYRFVQSWWEAGYAARWAMVSGLGLGMFLWWLWRGLGENHRPGEDVLLPKLGWGGALTFWRGVLACALFGFLISPQPQGWQAWLPGGIFSAAALLLPLAGWLARGEKLVTCLGSSLTGLVNHASLLIGTVLVVQYGQAPWWYLLVAVGRMLYIAAVDARRRLGQPITPLERRGPHRALAALEYIFLSLMLLPLLSPPVTTWAAMALMPLFIFCLWKDWQLNVRG